MTIAIGFRFNNGALLCADTKHTGQMVLYQPKLFSRSHKSNAKSVFAIVGNSAFARMAVDQCQEALELLPEAPWLMNMESAIQGELLKIHAQHIYPHPDRNMDGGPDFWLLAALWAPMDGLRTYYTTQTALVPFDVYHCAGSGEYLGHYLIKPQYQGPNGTLDRVVAIACNTLAEVKGYDANCGGNSEFVVLDNDGWLGTMREFNVAQTEKFSSQFHMWAGGLYGTISDVNLPPEKVDEAFDGFKQVILTYREKFKTAKESYNALVDALSRPLASQKSEPGK